MANRRIEIEKLSSAEDWNRWKWEVRNAFTMHDIAEYVDGTIKCPVKSTKLPHMDIDPELLSHKEKKYIERAQIQLDKEDLPVREWKKNDAFAKGVIMSALCRETTAKLILTCQTFKKCWEKLCSTYEHQHEHGLALKLQRFYGATRDPKDDMGMHVAKLQTIHADLCEALKCQGEPPVSQMMLIGRILDTLGPGWIDFM